MFITRLMVKGVFCSLLNIIAEYQVFSASEFLKLGAFVSIVKNLITLESLCQSPRKLKVLISLR